VVVNQYLFLNTKATTVPNPETKITAFHK